MTENLDSKCVYKDYWLGAQENRAKRCYYERLFGKLKDKIKGEIKGKVIDVGGGDGEFLQYLGISKADIVDVSESGISTAVKSGYGGILADIENRFPIRQASYDTAVCFEVLEHLRRPNKTLAEIHNILGEGGVLMIGQPNMRPDGVYHLRRYYLNDLLDSLDKTGFKVIWIDYVPAYSMRDAIVSDIINNPSLARRAIQCVNFLLSLLPYGFRYGMARLIPNRFALMFVAKAVKV